MGINFWTVVERKSNASNANNTQDMFDIHQIFDARGFRSDVAAPAGWLPRHLYQLIRGFYKHRIAWLALAISALVLVYGGGALMFWYHSIYLGEGGPAISPVLHYLIDSSAGFVALVPALAVILPVTARQATRYTGSQKGMFAVYAMLGGTLFALATVPGPLFHDRFVGRGTWVANQLTRLWGNGSVPGPAHHYAPPVSMSLQLAFALPVYIGLMALTLLAIRQLTLISRRSEVLQVVEHGTLASQD
jgi:hypothetical protein